MFFSHLDSQRFEVSHQSPLWVFDISWKSFPNPPPPISFPLLPPNDNWHRRKCRKKSESNSIHFSNSISCAEEFELEENIYLHFQQKKRHSSPVYKYNGCSNWFDIQELFFPMREVFISSLAFPRSPAWKVVVGEACDWSRLRRPVQSIVWTNLQGQGYVWDVKNLEILPTRVKLCLGCKDIGAYTCLVQTYRARAISGAKLVPTGASLCLIGRKRSICL